MHKFMHLAASAAIAFFAVSAAAAPVATVPPPAQPNVLTHTGDGAFTIELPEDYDFYGSGRNETIVCRRLCLAYFGANSMAISGPGGNNYFAPWPVADGSGKSIAMNVKIMNFKFRIGASNNDHLDLSNVVYTGTTTGLEILTQYGQQWLCYQKSSCIGGDVVAVIQSLGGINNAAKAGMLIMNGGKG